MSGAKTKITLGGLDGASPLGFLAALGLLRSLSILWPQTPPKMAWCADGAWRPVLHLVQPLKDQELVSALARQIKEDASNAAFTLADDLSVPVALYRRAAIEAVQKCDWLAAGFYAAMGSDAIVALTAKKESTIEDTAFRTMSGAGHQHFLQFVRNICAECTATHLHKAIFEPWRYDDPVAKLTLRFDPADDSRYALRAGDPSGDSTRTQRGSVLGANRLAIEALPLFPCAVAGGRLRTAAFHGEGSRDTSWDWPIWDIPLSLHEVRSALTLAVLSRDPLNRDQLRHLGIAEVFRSQRVTVGKFRNFSPAQPV